jgi:hypothetical protein
MAELAPSGRDAWDDVDALHMPSVGWMRGMAIGGMCVLTEAGSVWDGAGGMHADANRMHGMAVGGVQVQTQWAGCMGRRGRDACADGELDARDGGWRGAGADGLWADEWVRCLRCR